MASSERGHIASSLHSSAISAMHGQAFGKPALMATAWTHPLEFVRLVVSLIPRELEATTPVTERMSNAQLEAIIARDIEDSLDPAAADEDAQIIQ